VSARGPGFAVQVGAFSERSAADQLVGSLRGDRFPAYLVEGAPGEGARFRVRVGPYATREEASGQAGRLKERRRLPTWVIREGGP
jgi:cell division septation protein DedD